MIANQPVTAQPPQQGQDNQSTMPPLPQQRHKVVLVIDLVESVRLMAANEAAVVNRWRGFVQHATGHTGAGPSAGTFTRRPHGPPAAGQKKSVSGLDCLNENDAEEC